MTEIIHRSDSMIVQLEHLRVYPNGFTINLLVLPNPRLALTGRAVMTTLGRGGIDQHRQFPRVGVRFADGRTAGRGAWGPHEISKDRDGIPTEPIVMMTGGGGGSHGFHFGFWVFPLPPEGPLEIYVSVPAAGDLEAHLALDGGAVRAAANEATVIWS